MSWRFNLNLGAGKIKRHERIQPQNVFKTVGAFVRLSRDTLIHIYPSKAFVVSYLTVTITKNKWISVC